MKKPNNQTAEVLYELLTNKCITRMSVMYTTGILNLTARIADLRIRYGINIICDKVILKNKHGRPISYGKWRLFDKKSAALLYDKINRE
jgi:hypothetical protein